MPWNCFIDFVIEHWFSCRTTEPGFAGDIDAIEIWLLIDYQRSSPTNFLTKVWGKAKLLPGSETRKPKDKAQTKPISPVLTCHRLLPPLLASPPTLWYSWCLQPAINLPAFRWPKNLKNPLLRASVRYPPPNPGTHMGQANLKLLQSMSDTWLLHLLKNHHKRDITNSYTGHWRKSHRAVLAAHETTNLIYLFTCPLCKAQYLGEMQKKNYGTHGQYIAHERVTPVARHFYSSDHTLSSPAIYLYVFTVVTTPCHHRQYIYIFLQ